MTCKKVLRNPTLFAQLLINCLITPVIRNYRQGFGRRINKIAAQIAEQKKMELVTSFGSGAASSFRLNCFYF